MKIDIALGLSSLMTMLIGQTAITDAIPAMITQFGGLGLAVWLVYHHTMKTIPGLLETHRQERLELIMTFNKTLEEKRQDYKAEIEQQRKDFEQMLSRVACKAHQQ